MNYPRFKRCLDLLVAGLSLILLAPFLLVISILIRNQLGPPVLFTQKRPGLHGSPFKLYKFRTMTNAKYPNGEMLPDSERMTPLGRWLRGTSLDELPELYNIFNKDMSIVGPRPLLMEYLNRYSPEQARRHEVLPGITGWAQVNGRNALTWEKKFELDVWYVDNQSLALDLKIIALTVWKIIKREGISQTGHDTVEKFTG